MRGIIIIPTLHVRKVLGKGYAPSPAMQWVDWELPGGPYQYTDWQVGHVLLYTKYLTGESHWDIFNSHVIFISEV